MMKPESCMGSTGCYICCVIISVVIKYPSKLLETFSKIKAKAHLLAPTLFVDSLIILSMHGSSIREFRHIKLVCLQKPRAQSSPSLPLSISQKNMDFFFLKLSSTMTSVCFIINVTPQAGNSGNWGLLAQRALQYMVIKQHKTSPSPANAGRTEEPQRPRKPHLAPPWPHHRRYEAPLTRCWIEQQHVSAVKTHSHSHSHVFYTLNIWTIVNIRAAVT